MTEDQAAIILGCIGSAILAPVVIWGLVRLERWDSARQRANKQAIRDADLLAAMADHPSSGQVVASEVEFETTSPKFRRAS